MSEPRSSRRAKKAVNYEEPKPLSTREIRARMSQDSEEKKSRKRANSESSAASSAAKKPKSSTTPAPKKPAAKKTPRRLEETLAAESSTKKKARTPKTPTSDKARARHAAALSTEADEATKAARVEAKAWRDKYKALEKERITQAEREKDRSDGRASRLEALCREQERRLRAFEALTGCSLKVFALEATDDEEVECVATSNFTDRRLEFRLEVPPDGRIYFEAGAGAECLDEGMESSPIEFDRDQFPRFLSRILARVHRSEESAL